MRTIDVADATTTLSQYARKGLKEALVVTRRGKPLMALTPIRKGDWESDGSRHKPKIHGDHRALAGVAQAGDGYLDRGDAPPAGLEAPYVAHSATPPRPRNGRIPLPAQVAADP